MVQNTKRYTVITGASSGIGYETAKAFAKRGSNLILIARRKNRLEALQQEILTLHPTLDVVLKVIDLSVSQNVFKFYENVKSYPLQTWINNAGFGNYDSIGHQDLRKISQMLHLNMEALTILSSLFVRDFKNTEKAQLINVSSCGGYTVVPNAVTYCATKFYVSAFTEGLSWELKTTHAKMQAKVLAPAATKTEFGKIANDVTEYNYDKLFGTYHTSTQIAAFLLELYDSDKVVGLVDRENFSFHLCEPQLQYAGNSQHNQKM
ncbi:MAG: SDR family NAD(P)-dependent oxidoreductase [Lachnospiraceae bacterium]|nr:SDR family NAD(P)-dependent oxidoreductase [Lachnospiraceae bacterium]